MPDKGPGQTQPGKARPGLLLPSRVGQDVHKCNNKIMHEFPRVARMKTISFRDGLYPLKKGGSFTAMKCPPKTIEVHPASSGVHRDHPRSVSRQSYQRTCSLGAPLTNLAMCAYVSTGPARYGATRSASPPKFLNDFAPAVPEEA